jgi:hypothetical protein
MDGRDNNNEHNNSQGGVQFPTGGIPGNRGARERSLVNVHP